MLFRSLPSPDPKSEIADWRLIPNPRKPTVSSSRGDKSSWRLWRSCRKAVHLANLFNFFGRISDSNFVIAIYAKTVANDRANVRAFTRSLLVVPALTPSKNTVYDLRPGLSLFRNGPLARVNLVVFSGNSVQVCCHVRLPKLDIKVRRLGSRSTL